MSTTITPKNNGPLIVENLARLSSRKGAIAAQPNMALCRCGGSANKPFCDGSHRKNGFTSARQEGRVADKLEDYRAPAITIHDNRGICAHAGKCSDGLPEVFRYKQEPWIDPEAASPEAIAAVIRRCPSGALAHSPAERSAAAEPAIFVAPNGPYEVSGALELRDTAWGAGASKSRFTLCRCGGSRNKPFCDGSHWSNGFKDDKN